VVAVKGVPCFARASAELQRFFGGGVFRALRPPRADLLGYSQVASDPKREELPDPPGLPQRAAIYIAPDGAVHFGALFEGLVPVAHALANEKQNENENGHGRENENEQEHANE
jgi:hypothetical protein